MKKIIEKIKELLKPSKIGQIGLIDILKSLGLGAVVPVATIIVNYLSTGAMPSPAELQVLITAGIAVFKFLTPAMALLNSNGKFLQAEKFVEAVVKEVQPVAAQPIEALSNTAIQ